MPPTLTQWLDLLVRVMRFFSDKTRKSIIKALFTAIHATSSAFSYGESVHPVRCGLHLLVHAKNVSLRQIRKTHKVLYGLLLICVFFSYSHVDSGTVLTKKGDTLHVFPGKVEGGDWLRTDTIGSRDVKEDGIFQAFKKSNSASFIDEESETNYSEELESSDTDSIIENTNSSEEVINIAPEITTESQNEPEQTVESESVEVENGEVEATESVPTSFIGVRSPIFAFFNKFTALLPFASEHIVTPLESNTEATESTGLSEVSVVLDGADSEVSETISEEVLSGTENEEVVQESVGTETSNVLPVPLTTAPEPVVLMSDFALPSLGSGQFITNVQLRISFGAQYESVPELSVPMLDIEYRTKDEWVNAGAILMDSEVSNALNGGYFLFALPTLEDVHELEDLEVRAVYRGDAGGLKALYLDAAWLEISTEIFDQELLRARLLPSLLEYLTLPEKHELISTSLDFTRTEEPTFVLRYESQRNAAVRLFRSIFSDRLATVEGVTIIRKDEGIVPIDADIDTTVDGLWTIQIDPADLTNLQPGTYSIELTINEGGKIFTDSFDFQWGMLAVNPSQSKYTVGDTATLSFGALSQGGNTLCDANLELYIIDPTDFISRAPITPSGFCNGNNVIDVPDYTASFVPNVPGTYELYVERVDYEGNVLSHTSDTVEVVTAHEITLMREGPTRIYPLSEYPMEITLTSVNAFTGTLIEHVPGDFVVSGTDAEITTNESEHILTFNVNLGANESQTFSYTFDAPDISPYLYTLGPAEVRGVDRGVIIEETLPTNGEPLLSETIFTPIDETDAIEDGNQAVEEEGTEPEIVSSPTDISASLETDTEPIEPTEEVLIEEENVSTQTITPDEATSTVEDVTPSVSNETVTNEPEEIVDTSGEASLPVPDFVEHRAWQIASDATGSMILFWTGTSTIPSGWTCISCASTSTFYQRFPKGDASYGTTGGTATSGHTASAVVNASTATNAENNAGAFVSITAHSHTVTPTIGSTSTLPAYRQLRFIQNNSAGDPGTIPAGAVLIFDGVLPSGWAQYTPLDSRYPYGENTITSAGTNTHTHSVSGTTDAASGATVNSRTGGTQVTAAAASHTHTVSSSTPALSQEPPYIEVIFATSSSATATPLTSISMWSDTPPAGWLNRSGQAGDPFYNRYIKGASTYGTTGGSDTHTHADMPGVVSAVTASTDNARSGATGSSGSHTHAIDVSGFTIASNTPPYQTVIFAKRYGLVPIYTQSAYRWYTNVNSATVSDAWPTSTEDVAENEAIDSSFTPLRYNDVVRLRLQLNVRNSTTTGEDFKLQFGTTTSVCTTVGTWTDVGSATSSAVWTGYNNASPSDGATLSTSTLTGTDILETYEEQNPTVVLPTSIGIGQEGEWDFVLKHNGALAETLYCFRMVKSDDTTLFAYSQYPMLLTNSAPEAPILSKLFDNEKSSTTLPRFEFAGTDEEADDLSYQIQVDDDRTFSSANIDHNTISNSTLFENINTPADKDPYTNGETIRYSPTTALTNNTTYYWRVRAQDTVGSNTWGEWSTIYSFTIDTSATVSTWFQTTEEQFDTDTLSDTDALVTDLVQLATGSTTGTTTSSAIDFLDGSQGNAWGSLSFVDNETVGDIKYRIQYYSDASATWINVPDTALTGNSTGFDTSGVSLLSMDVSTYRIIRIVAVFTNSGGSPTLSDWTLSWGYRIETPTINAPFDNEKVSTTTPTFEFVTTDPQSDDLEYEIQWSTTYTFTASTTRNSSSSLGFVNITNGADLNPFTSGNTIQFTLQSGDALTNGSTYWWRIRAKDPLSSNEYSFYTDPQSITVDTSVTVSTWFQTTQSQFDTDVLSGAITQAGNTVTVATTSTESLIAYAEGLLTTPQYRVWSGSSWSAEASALDVGAAITWVVTRSAPSENEYLLGTVGTDGDVNIQVYQNGSWGDLQEVTNALSNTNMRGFDIAYEQTSGDALVVTCDGDSNPSYWIWDGASWTLGGATIGLVNGNTCGWIKLISDPTSDEIIAVTRDTSGAGYEARVWTGSAWGNSARLGSMNQANHEGIAAEYEESGGQAVIAVSNGTAASFAWSAWNGSAWTATATVALGDDFEAGSMAADDGSDNMALCYVDQDGDIGAVRWTGAAFTGQIELETAGLTAGNIYEDRPIDCIFEVGGSRDGYIRAVYSDTTNIQSRTWDGVAWLGEVTATTTGKGPRVQARRTGDNTIQVMSYATSTDRYDFTYSTSSDWWAPAQTLETNGAAGAVPFKEPFMITAKNPVTSGTVVGTEINFYDGSGPYFQQMSWIDSEPGGSSILHQVEYYDTASSSWKLIPDSLIPGNSVGTTISPINLTNVLPVSTYSLIRPLANMSCSGGTCPTLSDWTITWSAGIALSGTAQAYDQSTNVTAGSVAVALNGSLQIGKTGTIAAGAWSIPNVNASPGDVVTVFVNGANEVNEAVSVAHYDGVGDMSGMRLYEQHLTLGSNDATTTAFTNAQIALYDATNDEDLFFDGTGTILDMCVETTCGTAELYVMASSTYRPGGTVDVNYFENNGTTTLDGNTMYVTRSWDNNATLTAGTSTVIFTATSTTESIDETGALSPSFYNLTFGTTTGAATWNLITPLDVNNALTVTRGTLARGTVGITVGGSLSNAINGIWTGLGTTTFDGSGTSNWSDANATLQNIGRVVIDGTSKTLALLTNVKAQSITIGVDDIFDVTTGNYNTTVMSDWVNHNTFVARSGTVYFDATTTNRVITAGGDAFYNLNFIGQGGAWAFTEADLTISNDLTIATGTVTMPTGTTTLAGSWNSVGGTFAHNNALVYMTAGTAETIAASGTVFTNAFYNLRFTGSGSWSFLDTSATTSNDFVLTQGSVTLPSAQLSIGGHFTNSAGTFTHNSGTVRFTSATTKTIDTNSSFSSLLFTGSGGWSFVDTNVTAVGDLTVSGGTVTLPGGTLTLGGSFTNAATTTHNSGTVLFNATSLGKTLTTGNSNLYNVTINGVGGGFTVASHATTSNNFTLATSSAFTLSSGATLAVFGTFTNSVGGASTTWSGSTLSLEAGAYSLNTKNTLGDAYGTLRLRANTDIRMWNSTSSTYTVDSTGSLYSQDHNGIDGDLYIFGGYERTSGTEYWSAPTDFDGTSLLGSTRIARVRFASSSSALFTGSTLSITGTSTATTSIANQGSGTYTIGVANGTTSAAFYSFSNLGASGISLSGTTHVSALSDGEIIPGIAAGTGITVSSTTVNANAELQIYRVNFSTTTAIAATNITQTDGTPTTYWWFRESSGNIDGEAFDNDTGDPGSIRWDDSSLTITVSGTVYGADETTPLGAPTCGVGTPVRVVVSNGGTYDGACNGSGVYSIPGVVVIGNPTLTVFLNGASNGERAVAVTKTPTADISDLNLMVNRVIVRHEDVDAMTIADMALYDSTDDSDVPFTAATGSPNSLLVQANTELHVWATTTFTPGGTVTLTSGGTGTSYDGSLHLDNASIFTGAGTTTYSIGGSIFQDINATYVPASTTIIMTATTSGKTISTENSETVRFNELDFTGVGGAWNINGNASATANIYVSTGTVTGTGNISLANGSLYGNGLLSLGSGTTTIASTNTLGGSQAWTFGNLVLGNGTSVGTTTSATTATTTILGKLTIGNAHFFVPGGGVLNLQGAGTVFVETGSFVEGTSTVRYSGTAGSNVLSTNYYNVDVNAQGSSPTFTTTGLGIVVLNNLTVGAGATSTLTVTTNDTALDVNGNVTIGSFGTLIGSDSASFMVGGSWDNNGTFTGSGGTVTFDSVGTKTIAAGNSSFSNVTINAAGTWSISEHATATTAFTLTNATSFTVDPAATLAVGGTFTNSLGGAATTWTNSALHLYGGGNYQINTSSVIDTYGTLTISGTTQIRMWNSSAGTTTVASTGSLYSQDHANVNGALYIYGSYAKTSGTDYWSYATDFDGTVLGGSSRKVDVYFASSSSALYTGGGLSVLGISGASTTLQNQGAGTYGFRVGGSASTTMSYYETRNLNASGLVFSGTPNIVSLSYGDFVVSQSGGSAITVGGNVINQNPAKTFTNNTFGTSTGISAFNVTATGTSVSSWRFTNHSGSIDGESYDVDPDGDPGYVVWDDSAAAVTISGRVYSDEGSTVSTVCDGSTANIHLRVAGLTSFTTSCNGGSGLYSIPGVTYSPGDSLIVYIDGESEKAAVVSEDLISSVANMDLYENRIIVRHEDTDPLSIADMAVWDSSDDADIPFTAVDAGSDTLTLPADRKLIVWNGKTFRPDGNVTLSGGGAGAPYDGTLELFTNAVFDATLSEIHSIGGSLISGSGASIDDETSTFTFTTNGAARTIDTNEYALYNLTLNGSGSWTVTNAALDLANDLTITQGTLTLPTGTTTILGSLSNTGGTFIQNGGHMRFTSAAAETIRTNGSNFGTTTFAGSGSWTYQDLNATSTQHYTILSGTVTAPSGTLAIGGDFITAGTFTHNSGTLRLNASGTGTTSVTASTSDLYSVTFAGLGKYLFTDTNVDLLGTLRIEQGTATLATGTMAIGGSFLNLGGAFNSASGTILFNSSDVGETINPGSSTFNVVSIAAPSGGYTITNNATTTSNFSLTSASTFTLGSGVRLTVQGVFTNLVGGTWTGSTLRITTGLPYTINTSIAGGTSYNILLIGNNTDLRTWNSQATTTVEDSLSSLYSQDHAAVNGELNIYGQYERTTGTDYWSYATDFDGTALGGTERVVTVRIANGATTTFTGSTLHMLGGSGATTTVRNQGSGTYSIRMDSGTLNALNYAFRNLNPNGLTLTGNTTITSLSNGDFELDQNGGTLLTVSSTTVNYNASQVITGVRFATTTAISGTNITLTGTTPSAWTFTTHRGNLAGEAYDVDGATACGSIRWSDSTCLLTQQAGYRWRNDNGGESVPNSEWYDQNWSKRKRVTVVNADATTYTNAVVKVDIPYDGDMQTDFDDLRFTDSSGTTTLSYVRDAYTASTEATVWVKIPSLTASANTTLYMYYGNGGVSDGGVGTTTFVAYDDFEDNNITEYANDTSKFTTSVALAYQGSYGLKAVTVGDRTTHGIHRFDASVAQGSKLRFMKYVDTSAPASGDETCTLFGVQSPGTLHDNYGICLEQFGVDRISISRDVYDNDSDTGTTQLASSTLTYATGWYEVEVEWDTDDTIAVFLYKDGALVATTSVTDGTYTTGGTGFTFWEQHGAWDVYSARTLLGTEPTTTLGYEQVSGGASWFAALNTKASGISANTTVRPRFLIENTGLAITDQYRLEYAAKGNAPSCESVSSASYASVPVQASCTGSPICMVSSSQFANQASTTDVLGGTGTFTTGQIIEDPSNSTQSFGVGANQYTEVEYAITSTTDVTDSNYCLRVSDGGSPIDSYVRVAELELVFVPTVTSLSLNAGMDISLSPGATSTITATGTVTDQNGYADLNVATTTFYRSGVGASCSANTNNCYIAAPAQCTFSNCAGNSCDVSCSADFYYHTDPTDIGTYAGETWRATLSVSDDGGSTASGTAPSIDLLTLRAISVNSTIGYGALEVNSDTGATNASTTVENIGNDALDVSIQGTDLTDGASSVIPATQEKYATSTFTYSACVYCTQLTTSAVNYELNLPKPTSTTPLITDRLYWGIAIPSGVAGVAHTGTNIFYAIGD